jgi:hypothetical protein
MLMGNTLRRRARPGTACFLNVDLDRSTKLLHVFGCRMLCALAPFGPTRNMTKAAETTVTAATMVTVAQRARPFGFELAFYDPYLPAGVEKGLGGVTRADSFGSLLASVDVLSFHCPLTPCTRHMLDAAGLHARARAGCAPLVVINTARACPHLHPRSNPHPHPHPKRRGCAPLVVINT